jgi:hypothetical protein
MRQSRHGLRGEDNGVWVLRILTSEMIDVRMVMNKKRCMISGTATHIGFIGLAQMVRGEDVGFYTCFCRAESNYFLS